MNMNGLAETLRAHEAWRQRLIESIERYRAWLLVAGLGGDALLTELDRMRETVESDVLTVAFLAEFSRGKTELINALFFADTGLRLLPSSPGRTTMCPTEIFCDPSGESYIRLIGIETRLSDENLTALKRDPRCWQQIPLDAGSPLQMQEAFRALSATKRVPRQEAERLGLSSEDAFRACPGPADVVEIPCWRHALISFPHPLLQRGLVVVDTPGLNALGTEPELTLSLLPRAQAVVFVVAADSGVSKSDMDVWRCHVRGERQTRRKGLIVVLNKIDSVWDELNTETELEAMLQQQVESTARTLNVESRDVFPISAKQGLLAKIRGDGSLLRRSRLMSLERYLADDIVRIRQEILVENVVRVLVSELEQWRAIVDERAQNLDGQLAELRELGLRNDAFSRRLLEQAQAEQAAYATTVEALTKDVRTFSETAQSLQEVLAPGRIQGIVDRTRRSMSDSLTTFGMKTAMKQVLEELRSALGSAAEKGEGAGILAGAIFSQFVADPALGELKPAEFSMEAYQTELEEIFEQGEQFRASASSTSMYQTVVISRLYGTLIARAQVLFQLAYDESSAWAATVFVPLLECLRERRLSIEGRVDMYRKVHERAEALDTEIAALTTARDAARAQLDELAEIRRLTASVERSLSGGAVEAEFAADA